MAALKWAGVAYATLNGGQENVVLATGLTTEINGTTAASLGSAEMVVLEIVDNPTAKTPRLFFAPESNLCPANGVGVRSIGIGEKAKICRDGDTNAEVTFANGTTVSLGGGIDPSTISIASDKPCTIMVNYYIS